jgi:hypothetical protein
MEKRRGARHLLGVVLLSGLLVACGAGAPAIPHTVEGRGDCLSCHAQGEQGAPKMPPDHTGLPNNRCQACHKAQ